MSRRTIEFYDVDASTLTESGRKLLREYSGIPEDEINSHVEAMVSPRPLLKPSMSTPN